MIFLWNYAPKVSLQLKKSEIKALHTTRKLREKPSGGVAITPSHRSIKCQPKGKAPNFKENALKAMGKILGSKRATPSE